MGWYQRKGKEEGKKRPSQTTSVALPGLADVELGEGDDEHLTDDHHIDMLHDEIDDDDSEAEGDDHLFTDEAHIDHLHLEISDNDSEDSQYAGQRLATKPPTANPDHGIE